MSEALQKKLLYENKKADDLGAKVLNLITTPNVRTLDRKQKSDKTHPRGANQGEIRKRDFKRGEP